MFDGTKKQEGDFMLDILRYFDEQYNQVQREYISKYPLYWKAVSRLDMPHLALSSNIVF